MSDAVTSPPPDPAEASDAREFIDMLDRLRIWAGRPSLRRLRHLAGRSLTPEGHQVDGLPPSTVSYILNGRGLPGLPRLAFVEAYVTACLTACDLPPEQIRTEIARWQDAWRQIASPDDLDPATPQAEQAAPPVPASEPMPARPARGRVALVGLAGLVAGALIATGVALLLWPAGKAIPLVRGEDPNRCDSPNVCFYDHGQTGHFRDVTDDYQSLNDSRDTLAMVNPRKDDVVWLRWEDGHSECTMPFTTYRLAPKVAEIRISRDYRCPSYRGGHRAVVDPAAVVPAPLPPCYATTPQSRP
ncbi:helix-turn-helix transcriptional regulator [Nonomuraea sp. B12E4]|uniref:helix-turn-helix domain-containing protein n=1 Tax=Nonomuraea sp. B12E4 TaxID=3153564 RepID=UPI00325E5B5F